MLKKLSLFISLIFIVSSTKARLIENIVAIVNGEIITLSDMENYKKRLSKGSLIDDLLVKPNEMATVRKDEQQILSLMIDEKILDSEVKKEGLEVTMDRAEKEIDSIAQKNNISRDELKKALALEGVRFSDYQNFTKTRIERQSLVAKSVTSKIKISDDELFSYYSKATSDKSFQAYEYTIAHILFNVEQGSIHKNNRQPKEILELLDSKKKTFNELAREYSADKNSLNNNAILGTFRSNELSKNLSGAVEGLNVGEHSQVIHTSSGARILKLLDKKKIPNPQFEREKSKIRTILSQEAFKKQFKFWLEQKRKSAFIKINQSKINRPQINKPDNKS